MKPLVLVLVGLFLVAACGDDEEVAHWSCFQHADEPYCWCEPGNEPPPATASVTACAGLECCFASEDSCRCFGLTTLISDCSLIQATDAVRVESCPAG